MRLQFTDILGATKNVEVPDRQFGEALDGRIMFDGSSIEGFVRTRRVRHVPQARPLHVPGVAVDLCRRRAGRTRHLRHRQPRRDAVCRLPALDAEARNRPGGRAGLRDAGRPRGRVLPLPARVQDGQPTTETARLGRLLRPHAGGPGGRRAARDRALARADGISRRGRTPRGGAGAARDRLPARRRAAHGRQRQHVPVRREERREPQRPARDLHAEAGLRHQRQRHAHAPVAVLARPQRVLRREGGTAAERDVPALRRRPAQARQERSAPSPTRS